MNCEGCGALLRTGAETFGAVGQAFCFDCWQEEQELEIQRELLEPEMESLRQQIRFCERDRLDAIRFEIVDLRLRCEATIEAATMRMEDIQEELDCLTVQFQRRFSVIGRAA